MKYLSKITIGLILCTGLTTSCKDDDEAGIADGIVIDKEEITIGPEGGTEAIAVSSNASWVAGSSKPWIAVSPANGIGLAECSLAIDSTLENTVRTAQIRFSRNGKEPKLITITQFGYGKQIMLKEPNVEIENSDVYDKRYFEATISTNVNFEIDKKNSIEYSFAETESMTEEEKVEMENERTNWITIPKSDDLKVDLDRKARPRTIKVRFRWDMNTAPFTRIAKIRLVPQKPEEDQLVDNDGNKIDAVILTVTQKPALKIEDNRSGDSLAIVTINQKMQSMVSFDTSESMQNWKLVTLWEETDTGKGLPSQEAIGRVRSVSFMMFNLKDGETLPKEIRHLKYLESLTMQSNENRQIREVSLGEEICELKYLTNLVVFAYGMVKLPDNFIKLGGEVDKNYRGLEILNLASNNFPKLSTITDVVNKDNFPKLRTLTLNGCRRIDTFHDLSQAPGSIYNGNPIGLHSDISNGTEKEAFLKLLIWDNLRNLSLSYNFIEGKLPTDAEMEAALTAAGKNLHYQESDFSDDKTKYLDKLVGDTCIWLKTNDNEITFKEVDGTEIKVKGQDILRVLPKVRKLSMNLNYLTGPLPKWILFHPYLVEWGPETLFFSQEHEGKNSNGESVKFSNIDEQKFDYTYYHGDEDPGTAEVVQGVAYPLYYRRYVSNSSSPTN